MLEKLSRQIADELHKLGSSQNSGAQAELVKQLLQNALRSMNLVTREEFDAQTAVLQRTREKLDALSGQLSQLEATLQNNLSGQTEENDTSPARGPNPGADQEEENAP